MSLEGKYKLMDKLDLVDSLIFEVEYEAFQRELNK